MEKVTKHKELKVDEFVRVDQVTGPVVDRLSVAGQVVKVSKEFIEVKTFDGTVGISLNDDDYKLEVSKLKKKPAGWDKFIKNPNSRKKTEEAAPVINKRHQVYKIVKNNPRKKLDSLLKQATEEIGGEVALLKKYVEAGILKFRGV